MLKPLALSEPVRYCEAAHNCITLIVQFTPLIHYPASAPGDRLRLKQEGMSCQQGFFSGVFPLQEGHRQAPIRGMLVSSEFQFAFKSIYRPSRRLLLSHRSYWTRCRTGKTPTNQSMKTMLPALTLSTHMSSFSCRLQCHLHVLIAFATPPHLLVRRTSDAFPSWLSSDSCPKKVKFLFF